MRCLEPWSWFSSVQAAVCKRVITALNFLICLLLSVYAAAVAAAEGRVHLAGCEAAGA